MGRLSLTLALVGAFPDSYNVAKKLQLGGVRSRASNRLEFVDPCVRLEDLLGEAAARAEVPVKKSACVCRHANKNCTYIHTQLKIVRKLSDGTKIRVGGNFIAPSPSSASVASSAPSTPSPSLVSVTSSAPMRPKSAQGPGLWGLSVASDLASSVAASTSGVG